MSKRRTIVPKKEVERWVVFEGRIIATGYSTRKEARAAAVNYNEIGIEETTAIRVRGPHCPDNFKYVGRCTHGYRYIILDTH